jgi:hypothetical protein
LGGLDILIISAGTGESSEELNWGIDKMTVDTNVNGFTEIANWAFNYFVTQGMVNWQSFHRWVPTAAGRMPGTMLPVPKHLCLWSFKSRRLNKNVSVTCIESVFDTKMAKSINFLGGASG